MPQATLLRYIGGKSQFLDDITPYIVIPKGGVYCEPFVGGGSVAIAVARRAAYQEARIIINDFDPEVANFWQQVINPDEAEVALFLDHIRTCRPSLSLHDAMKASSPTNPTDRAFRFLFLNRTSHAASHGKRPLGGREQPNPDRGIASRFKPDNIIPEFLKARRVLLGRTTVLNKDFADAIASAQANWVIYADPPYYERNLYDVSFGHDDHVRLRDMLAKTPAGWVLSYQEHPTVLELYQGAEIHSMTVNHSMNKRQRNELIITPKDR